MSSEDPESQRLNIRRFDDNKAPGPEPLADRGNEAPGRIHVLDDVEARDDIEVPPGRCLHHAGVNRGNEPCEVREVGIGLDSKHGEMFTGDPQEIASGAPYLEEPSGAAKRANEVDAPAGVQRRETLLFRKGDMPEIRISPSNAFNHIARLFRSRTGSKGKLGAAAADVSEAAGAAFHQRPIQPRGLKDDVWMRIPAEAARD